MLNSRCRSGNSKWHKTGDTDDADSGKWCVDVVVIIQISTETHTHTAAHTHVPDEALTHMDTQGEALGMP